MTEQQITEFDRWFEQRMDPELNLTPGDKELCRHAWKAALSHAEWEAVGTLTIDRHGDEKFHALLPAIDLEPGTYEVYTHPAPAGEQPVSDPDGLPDRVLMPRALTAENGAKTALSDEFFVDFGVRCARCGSPDFSLDLGQCAACQHTECEPNRRAVSWTTIKRIYSRAVEFLGVPAPDEREIAAKALSDFADRMGAKHGDTENGQFFIDCAEQAHEEAAPAAPAGELVTRCTAGLGCDEKGYCDAAATGQGDLCDRRTMAHEQPVSDPDGLPEPGRREAEQAYINGAFDYARDPIGSRDWILFWNGWRARNKAAPAPDEREIAALLERIVPRIDPQNPKPLDKSEHCCECTLYYERERIHDEIARLRKLGGNHD